MSAPVLTFRRRAQPPARAEIFRLIRLFVRMSPENRRFFIRVAEALVLQQDAQRSFLREVLEAEQPKRRRGGRQRNIGKPVITIGCDGDGA